jgi:hypothetical protein
MKRFILSIATILTFGIVTNAQEPTYISSDLLIEDLKGNVAKVEYVNEYGYIDNEKSFNQQGYIIPQGIVIKRDEWNRIVSIKTSADSDWEYEETYTYDANGRLTNKEYEDGCTICSYTYYYDNTDSVIRVVNEGENDDSEYTITTEYLIMARDNKGNWTKRSVKSTTVCYGEVTDQDTTIETRRITYR